MKKLDEKQKKHVAGLLNEFRNFLAENGLSLEVKNRFLKEKGLLKEEFEVNKWYKFKKELLCVKFNTSNPSYCDFYGLSDGHWFSGSRDFSRYVLATDEEVGQALIKEAKKKGYLRKHIIVLIDSEKGNISDSKLNGNYTYRKGELMCSGDCGIYTVFSDGKWAEIVEEKKEDRFDEMMKNITEVANIIRELKEEENN